MKTVEELISNLENSPKKNETRYVRQEDLRDAIICLEAFREACNALVNVADVMGILEKCVNNN